MVDHDTKISPTEDRKMLKIIDTYKFNIQLTLQFGVQNLKLRRQNFKIQILRVVFIVNQGRIKEQGMLPTNCLSVFDNFVGLKLKGLKTLSNAYDGTFFAEIVNV